MASGKWRDMRVSCRLSSIGKLEAMARWTLTPEEWKRLMTDFSIGAKHVEMELVMKCSFWARLPWRLCAMALPSEAEGREYTSECVCLFDAELEGHHRTTTRFFQLWLVAFSNHG